MASTQHRNIAQMAAYAAAVFFALHLLTYFIPSIRDATLDTAATVAILLGLLAILQHLVVFPSWRRCLHCTLKPLWAAILLRAPNKTGDRLGA
ncbi:MAG TPA: hypothetical protein VGP82_02000 [Ktedonobacterales bacterium]|nr:hypothetical protein [Ktedonobacterales bacterium]